MITMNNTKSDTIEKAETFEIDADILEWFKQTSENYEAKINLVLRAYMQVHRLENVKR